MRSFRTRLRRWNARLRRRAWTRLRAMTPGIITAMTWHRRTVSRNAVFVTVGGSAGKTVTTRLCRAVTGHGLPPRTHLGSNRQRSVAAEVFRQTWWGRPYIVEIGTTHPGALRKIASRLRPSIAIVMAVGTGGEHMRSFRDIEHFRDEEAAMVRALPPRGTAILNGDDPHTLWMAGQTRARVLTFGLGEACDVRACDIRLDWPRGTTFDVHYGGRAWPVRTRLVGDPGVYSALAAFALGIALRKDPPRVARAIASVASAHGRMEPLSLPVGATVLADDAGAKLESVYAALDLLERTPARRRLVALGGMDSPPAPQRPHYKAVGERVAQVADRVVLLGNTWEDYRPGLYAGGMAREQFTHVKSVAEAAEVLRAWIQPGDVLLLKGRHRQRLARAILLLQGRAVRCTVRDCPLDHFCGQCPRLERGWG